MIPKEQHISGRGQVSRHQQLRGIMATVPYLRVDRWLCGDHKSERESGGGAGEGDHGTRRQSSLSEWQVLTPLLEHWTETVHDA